MLQPDRLDADWLRTLHWDLPTDPDEFLGSLIMPLDEFMALPAAEAMPQELRDALIAGGIVIHAVQFLADADDQSSAVQRHSRHATLMPPLRPDHAARTGDDFGVTWHRDTTTSRRVPAGTARHGNSEYC